MCLCSLRLAHLSGDSLSSQSVPSLNTSSQLRDGPSLPQADVSLQSEIGPSQSGDSLSSQSVPPQNTSFHSGDGPSQPGVDVPLQSEVGPSWSWDSTSSQSAPPQNASSQSEDAHSQVSMTRGRKRKRYSTKWKRNIAKFQCNTGEGYINKHCIQKPARVMKKKMRLYM